MAQRTTGKRVVGQIKLQIPAGGQATPAPPVGPALGQAGVNIMDFCKAFNARTQNESGTDHSGGDHGLCGPHLHLHHQDSARRRPAEARPRRSTRVPSEPNRNKVGVVTRAQLEEIAQAPRWKTSTRSGMDSAVQDHRRNGTLHGPRGRGLIRSRTVREQSGQGRTRVATRGSRYREASGCGRRLGPTSWKRALHRVPEGRQSYAKFDETFEIALRLGVDPKHADQMVRGTDRAAATARARSRADSGLRFSGEKMQGGRSDAGADHVGGDELAATRIQRRLAGLRRGHLDPRHDAGRRPAWDGFWGRRGLMPNPKSGTVTSRRRRRRSRTSRRVRSKFRVDKAGIIHAPLGKLSFDVGEVAWRTRRASLGAEIIRAQVRAAAKGRVSALGQSSARPWGRACGSTRPKLPTVEASLGWRSSL